MKWAIEIQFTTLDHENLADLLNHLQFTLIKSDNVLLVTSAQLDLYNSANEVFDCAKKLRSTFTGASQIDHKFEIGRIFEYPGPRRHVIIELKPSHQKTEGKQIEITVSPPVGLSDQEYEEWQKKKNAEAYQSKLEQQLSKLIPAHKCERAEKMLELLILPNPTAETIFKIYEIAEERWDKAKFHELFEINWHDFKRFSDAVHNASVSGDWARHATLEKARTENPMTRHEAETFVRSIAAKWLNYIRVTS